MPIFLDSLVMDGHDTVLDDGVQPGTTFAFFATGFFDISPFPFIAAA
jgi:hypothetical protein